MRTTRDVAAQPERAQNEGHSPNGRSVQREALRGLDYAAQMQALAPVQAKGDAGGDVHAHAARGIAGGGGALPHLAAIQQAFGRHDVGGVKAHTGGDAALACQGMGAQAYATGNDVAFGGAPSLHTAAHEAAHVVQQRAGVQLKGGVGQSGDAYERHADAVADAVVQGKSAEGLLDQYAGGTGAGAGVQMKEGDETPPAESLRAAKVARVYLSQHGSVRVEVLIGSRHVPDLAAEERLTIVINGSQHAAKITDVGVFRTQIVIVDDGVSAKASDKFDFLRGVEPVREAPKTDESEDAQRVSEAPSETEEPAALTPLDGIDVQIRGASGSRPTFIVTAKHEGKAFRVAIKLPTQWTPKSLDDIVQDMCSTHPDFAGVEYDSISEIGRLAYTRYKQATGRPDHGHKSE